VKLLIAPGVINTMALATLRAFADHGTVRPGVALDAITTQLERDGVRSFCDSYQQLLDRIAAKVGTDIPV
jgi:transaldolase